MRAIKQLIIAIIFFSLVGGVTLGLKDLVTQDPTCFDNIQNQGEEGVDCGVAVCGKLCAPQVLPIEVKSQKLIKVGDGDYDFVAQVYNPNSIYGSGNVQYSLTIKNDAGDSILEQAGEFDILASQTKYIVEVSLELISNPNSFDFKIINTNWSDIKEDDPMANFLLRRESFTQEGNSSQYVGVIYNDSFYDFDSVNVNVILQDDLGNIVGVNKTTVRTFVSGSERQFVVRWPYLINNPKILVQATTNIFDTNNYIQRDGSQEKFQELNKER